MPVGRMMAIPHPSTTRMLPVAGGHIQAVERAKPGQCGVSRSLRECPQPGKLGCWAWPEDTLLIRMVRDAPSRGTRAGMQLCLIPQAVYNNCYKYRDFVWLQTLRPCFCCWSARSVIWPPDFDTAKIKRRQHIDSTLQKKRQQNHKIPKTLPG